MEERKYGEYGDRRTIFGLGAMVDKQGKFKYTDDYFPSYLGNTRLAGL
jgi:hypothetical protein